MPIKQRYLSRLALHRALMLTLIISVLLHLVVFSEFSFQLPSEDERVVLQAELVSTPPPCQEGGASAQKTYYQKIICTTASQKNDYNTSTRHR